MKLERWQIVILLLMVWLYTNGSAINIVPKPFVPNMDDEDLESKVIAAMILIADESKPVPVKQKIVETPDTEVAEVITKPLWEGRLPRLIILTDLTNCAPCINYEAQTVNLLKGDSYKKRLVRL